MPQTLVIVSIFSRKASEAQVKQLFSFHGPRARGVLVLSRWPTRPELSLMMAGEVKEGVFRDV